MKTAFRLLLLSLVLVATSSLADAQTPEVTHNTWSSGAPMPAATWFPAGAGVINNQIYVVGGYDDSYNELTDNQIYNPATNTWSTGASLPAATAQGASAVVKNILYIFGGCNAQAVVTNAVWAYSSKTKSWSSKTAMPTARCSAAAAVEKNIIYVIGGYANGVRLNTVEAYDPATDSWTEEAPLLLGKSEPTVGLIGTAIVAADGYSGSDNGDNEEYNAATNTWTSLAPDPTGRNGACGGTIGSELYVAGGYPAGGQGTPALTVNESFKPSKNKWTTLAPMPQASLVPASAVYKKQLYCFGGVAAACGSGACSPGYLLNNVQIYQP